VPSREGTLAPHSEYNSTVRLRRRCGLMSNYSDYLLLLLLLLLLAQQLKNLRGIFAKFVE